MVIIVYSSETAKSIAANIGVADYSYFFVMEKYRKILNRFATVIEIRNPLLEVDVIYNKCRSRGEQCFFLSFTPPFKTETELKCPMISVFAWEYTSIPTDEWGGDPRNDWRNVFQKHGCTITHSSFALRAVRDAMGSDFPVWSIPAPVWDEYTKHHNKVNISAESSGFNLSFTGNLMDFQGYGTTSVPGVNGSGFIEERSSLADGKKINLHLDGIIYTTVFNPNDGRKNWSDLLSAFVWAFREVEDVILVLKLSYHDYETVRTQVIDEIIKLEPFKCRVVAIHGYLDKSSYDQLVSNTTYVVNSSHGEGQCLPLMEYMSAGKPAIAPSHTAMGDYITVDNSFSVNSSIDWVPWPHDPRLVLRTYRYRINWESLYHSYLESYSVAKSDRGRYSRMSECSVESLKNYCSEAVVTERLKNVFRESGISDNEISFSGYMRRWYRVYRVLYLLKTWRVNILLPAYVYFKNILKTRFPGLFKFLMKGYGYVRRKKNI